MSLHYDELEGADMTRFFDRRRASRPSYEHLPRSGTDLLRADSSRDFINIFNLTNDVLAFRYFMRRVHGWQSVLNCICCDHGRPNAY